jgi:hypothetical protein
VWVSHKIAIFYCHCDIPLSQNPDNNFRMKVWKIGWGVGKNEFKYHKRIFSLLDVHKNRISKLVFFLQYARMDSEVLSSQLEKDFQRHLSTVQDQISDVQQIRGAFNFMEGVIIAGRSLIRGDRMDVLENVMVKTLETYLYVGF